MARSLIANALPQFALALAPINVSPCSQHHRVETANDAGKRQAGKHNVKSLTHSLDLRPRILAVTDTPAKVFSVRFAVDPEREAGSLDYLRNTRASRQANRDLPAKIIAFGGQIPRFSKAARCVN